MNQTRLYVSAALAVVVMSVGMFMMKADVQVLSTQKDKLMKNQHNLLELQRVLTAEYAHLARPERLSKLAGKMGFEEVQEKHIMAYTGVETFGRATP